MRKSIIPLVVAGAVGLGTFLGGIAIHPSAASISGLKNEQNQIQEKRSDVESNMSDVEDKIGNLQNQQSDVKTEMKRIDAAIGQTTKEIQDKTEKVNRTKQDIEKLQKEIAVLQERIEKRNELLKERARSYQETGGMINYLDVLLGATSFSDFIDRANAVATIMQADQVILKQQESDKEELEAKQKKVEKELASIQKMVAELEKMNQKLSSQRAEKDKLLASLVKQEEEEHSHMMELKEQEQILAAQEAAIKKAIKQEQDRLAREAAEAKKRAAQKKSGSSSSSAASSSGSVPQLSGGSWTQPAVGYLSSGFGGRSAGMHYGVDIANGSDVPIVAAANGVVIRAYYSTSYGNCVFISHSVDGKVVTTVYAHMSSLSVSSGQTVSKGQKIGVMGNTGASRGQHLHFELHNGPWTNDKRNAINPVGIVPLP